MKTIKIGSLFKYKHNGKHENCTIVILYNKEQKKRYLYNLDYKVPIGDHHLLYAEFLDRKLSRNEILNLELQ